MRNPAKRALRAVLRPIVSSSAHAALVTWMANSGVGTDATLKRGSLPLPVNFYSPVPDIEDLRSRGVWGRRSSMAGIDFRPEDQVTYLLELGRKFGAECAWPPDPTGDAGQFHTENSFFSFGCAASAHCLIRERKPRRLIEIGSGMSSMVLSAALQRNEDEGAAPARYTVIDPFPSPRLAKLPGVRATVIDSRAEVVALDVFDELNSGDILFIDSGHVVRIGGDVNYLIIDVLPRLRAGVVVHFHDISLPYEYPEVYLTNPAFRVLWTEAYLLQAFLAHNSEFEVLLGMAYVMQDQPEAFRAAFPSFDPEVHKATSGSFWIARRSPPG